MAPFLTKLGLGGGSTAGFGFGRKKGSVPAGKPIIITMWGAGGGGVQYPGGSPTWGTPAPGGAGGSLFFSGTYTDLQVVSGQTLYLYVGGGGSGAPAGGSGGPNGGHPGSGGSAGPGGAQGGGGGMSSIYRGGTFSTGTLMFIAGGGGAGSFQNIATYPSGWPPPTVPQPIANGSGGSQSSGGAAGVSGNPSYPPGNAGSQFTGGAGSPASNGKAGGGGAGYYGGGGGASDTGAANGGGAGGLRTNLTGHPLAGSAFPVSTTPGSYTITVGGGGAAGGGLATLSGGTGGNSSFGPTIVSDGGGGGASVDAPSSGKSGGYDGGGSIINSHSWVIYDTSRNVNNPSGSILAPNKAFAEENNSTDIDFLSNGFKIRTNRSNINPGSTQTVIYAAFAETPSFNLYGGQANAR